MILGGGGVAVNDVSYKVIIYLCIYLFVYLFTYLLWGRASLCDFCFLKQDDLPTLVDGPRSLHMWAAQIAVGLIIFLKVRIQSWEGMRSWGVDLGGFGGRVEH